MKKEHIIRIPDPCQEDWNLMPVNGKGRDCSKCERNIRDFTKMSDRELIAVLNSEKKICGRFTENQLNRPLIKENRGLMPTFNLYAVAAGFGALITFPTFGAENSYQDAPIKLVTLIKNSETISTSLPKEIEDSLTHFYVLDDTYYHRLVGANLILIDDKGLVVEAIQTDDEGYVSYSFEALKKHRIREIKISATDKFEEQIILWTPDDEQRFVITLKSTEKKEAPIRYLGLVAPPGR